MPITILDIINSTDGIFQLNPKRKIDTFFFDFNRPGFNQHKLFTNSGIARVYDNWDNLPFEIRANVAMAYLFLIHGEKEFHARSM
jgi:hypothetical protein